MTHEQAKKLTAGSLPFYFYLQLNGGGWKEIPSDTRLIPSPTDRRRFEVDGWQGQWKRLVMSAERKTPSELAANPA